LITIRGLLSPADVQAIVARLHGETFVDGYETAGRRARDVKRNEQLPLASSAEAELNSLVVAAFDRNDVFRAAALPVELVPIRFARYLPGMEYGWHTDNALMSGGGVRGVRTDLACTIFLSEPDSYAGGELAVQNPLGLVRIKLAAGDAVLYPATAVHRVEPVTQGVRLVAVTWIQSMIKDREQRDLLLDLAQTIAALEQRDPRAPEVERLHATRQNLIRMWGNP
jgi:PKHD-type hydroxylase